MYKWIMFYLLCIGVDIILYEMFSPSIFLFQGVFICLFAWRSDLNLVFKIFSFIAVSAVYGIIFQQNLGLLLLCFIGSVITHVLVVNFQGTLDAEPLLSLLLFNFLGISFIVLGSIPSVFWYLGFVLVNFFFTLLFMLIFQRVEPNEGEFV